MKLTHLKLNILKECELFNHFSELIVEYPLRAKHSRHDRWSLHTEINQSLKTEFIDQVDENI